jgi:Glycosyl transferases group 1
MRAIFITPEENSSGFEPIMWLRSQEMIQGLREKGVEVFPLEVNAFAKLMGRHSDMVAQFSSDFVIAPNFNYFLLAVADQIKVLDSLDQPIVALWDDPLGALANFINRQPSRLAKFFSKITTADPTKRIQNLIQPIADTLENSRRNFRSIMRHPLLKHFSWDSGHIEAVDSLGLLEAERVKWYPLITYSAFLTTGTRPTEKTRDVGFCGNVYLGLLKENDLFKTEFLKELTVRICEQKLESLDRSVWNLMTEEIQKLPRGMRRDYGLYYNSRPFWDYYIFLVWHAANTLVRLEILNKVNREVSLYGLFADPKSLDALKDYPKLKYEGNAHHFNELPHVYASTKINICISNGLVYDGIPSKLVDCLASGGFALCDPKEDLVRFFGPVVERIFFRNVEELNSKIEYYLAHPIERDEIVTELGLKIRQHCTVQSLMQKVIECVKS